MAAWTDAEGPRRRHAPRAMIQLDCTLTRRKGGPIACHTLDLGPGGMRVESERPLGVDEILHFDIPVEGAHVDGDARVLRAQGRNVYALRFETMRDEVLALVGTLTSR
jgi:hypothetical protein